MIITFYHATNKIAIFRIHIIDNSGIVSHFLHAHTCDEVLDRSTLLKKSKKIHIYFVK